MSTKTDILFDRRVVTRNIKHGRLAKKEFEQYLTSLPDVATKAVPMFTEAQGGGGGAEGRGEER